MAEAQDQFFAAISKGDLHTANTLLEENSVRLTELVDAKKYTPLHIACLSDNEALAEFLLSYIKAHSGASPETVLASWVNVQNDEDFTAICFACFRGNLRLINLLIESGAKLSIENARKLQLMHVAAQGNQPAVIAYLLEHGFSVDCQDVKGGTPLHWAAFMGCEMAASLLLALKSPVNGQDLEGQTPLHLAALAGNSKIVRCLLVKGADRQIKVGVKQDSLGRTALDVAKERKHEQLFSMLEEPGCLSECALRPPLRPYRRMYFSMSVYLILFILGTILNVFLTLKSRL